MEKKPKELFLLRLFVENKLQQNNIKVSYHLDSYESRTKTFIFFHFFFKDGIKCLYFNSNKKTFTSMSYSMKIPKFYLKISRKNNFFDALIKFEKPMDDFLKACKIAEVI